MLYWIMWEAVRRLEECNLKVIIICVHVQNNSATLFAYIDVPCIHICFCALKLLSTVGHFQGGGFCV